MSEAEQAPQEKVFTSENYSYYDDPKNYDQDGNLVYKDMSCDTLRKKITMFLATKEMTQTDFLKKINVNSNSFRHFMSYKGATRGSDNGTYRHGIVFFAERDIVAKMRAAEQKKAVKDAEKAEKAEAKKAQGKGKKRTASDLDEEDKDSNTDNNNENTTAAATATTTTSSAAKKPTSKAQVAEAMLAEVAAVSLDDERVFDDCDEVRAKIAVCLQRDMAQSRFAVAIGVNPRTISLFLAKKGPQEGAGSVVYVGAYRFFEKLRIARNEPKSEKRKKHEKEHPNGFELKDPPRHMWVYVGPK